MSDNPRSTGRCRSHALRYPPPHARKITQARLSVHYFGGEPCTEVEDYPAHGHPTVRPTRGDVLWGALTNRGSGARSLAPTSSASASSSWAGALGSCQPCGTSWVESSAVVRIPQRIVVARRRR